MAPETPKGVSSRLLSMKFMQRAAASAGSTPGSDSDGHSAKKRKLGHDAQDQFSANIDQASIQAAIAERETKRQAALDQHGGNDTHWVLDTNLGRKPGQNKKQPLNVVYVGYGDIDPSDDDAPSTGRTSTNDYKETKTSATKAEDADSEDQATDEDDDDDNHSQGARGIRFENGTPVPRGSRSRSQSRHSTEVSKAKEFRDKRKKKDVKLNKLTSISSAGASHFVSPQNNKSMACFNCQRPGHKASDCPNKGSTSSSKRD